MTQSGILPLLKPAGFTSHDLVMQARRWLKTREVGHAGTLDPAVTGVLPLCIGRATKLVPILMEQTKAYEGIMAIGEATTTEDAEGEVTAIDSNLELPSNEAIDVAIESFVGALEQVPPMYSAVKVKGKRLYEYARANEYVERPIRTVTIHEMNRTDDAYWAHNGHVHVPFSVVCSKGTYVRTLAVDLGKKLGFHAHLHQLTRTMSAGMTLSECITPEEMQLAAQKGTADQYLRPVEEVLSGFPHFEVTRSVADQVENGAVLDAEAYSNAPRMVLTHDGTLLALYKQHANKRGKIKPDVMFITASNRERKKE